MVAFAGLLVFARGSMITRTGIPACHALTSAFEYRASSMNQKLTSMPTRSAAIRLSTRVRQLSADASHRYGAACASEDTRKVHAESTITAAQLFMPQPFSVIDRLCSYTTVLMHGCSMRAG